MEEEKIAPVTQSGACTLRMAMTLTDRNTKRGVRRAA
jgi:hypothetical protein